VERNVVAPPAPYANGVYAELQATAARLPAISPHAPGAYHEIWLDGERVSEPTAEPEREPIYGKVYLPRKFKTGLGLPRTTSWTSTPTTWASCRSSRAARSWGTTSWSAAGWA